MLKSINIKNRLNQLGELFFPRTCCVCQSHLMQSEQCLCIECLAKLPLTNYHLIEQNPLEQRIITKCLFEKGTALFFYHKSETYQNLIHHFKYHQRTEIGAFLAHYATQIMAPFFSNIELIVPVPLHPNKLKKRGFNQSDIIAHAIGKSLQVPVDNTTLTRIIENPSQTSYNLFERWENTQHIFRTKDNHAFSNKQILIVDDVFTTGSTIAACVLAIYQKHHPKISFFTLACV